MRYFRFRRGVMCRAYRRGLLLIFLATTVLIFLVFTKIYEQRNEETRSKPLTIVISPENMHGFTSNSHRVVHLDLKGAPPKLSYLKVLLPILASLGCDMLLVEYEDMFPYTGRIINISAKNSYTRKEVRELLTLAHDLGLEVIPLVQTFGHLEHVLKLKEWSHLREIPPYPEALCPSNDHSFRLIQEMIAQIMSLHSGARYIHIGADEVYHLGVCPLCVRKKMKPQELFIKHVKRVAQFINENYPNTQPIIWDDMMRSWTRVDLEASKLAEFVQPMIWVYSRNVYDVLRSTQWSTYMQIFPKVWVAGAFKGALTPTSIFPDLMNRYENQKSWLNLLKTVKKTESEIVGYVSTGWSRYDHFAVLCEILPAGLPSLFLNLISLNGPELQDDEILKKWAKSLSCPNVRSTDLNKLDDVPDFLYYCTFPGVDLFKLLFQLSVLKMNVENIEKSLTREEGWMTSYNIRHNFTSPYRIIQMYTENKVFPTLNALNFLKRNITFSMNQYFDIHTTNEFLQQKLLPLQNTLLNLSKTLDKLIIKKVWPRRPLY